MQEKKNKRRLTLLIVLIAITGGTYWLSIQERAAGVNKNLFRLDDYKAVNRVVLDPGTHKVELTFNGSRWRVNDRYDADRNMIDVLFATLRQAEPRRPVASSQQDSMAARLEQQGIQVALYAGQERLQQFSAGGNALKTQSYFKHLQTGKVYLVTIPGYRVYVSGILELTENQWRDKYAFGFNWRNFKSLEAEFPDNPSGNFKVAPQGAVFGIEGLARTDTARLNTFLDRVSLLTVNEYLESGNFTDSLTRARPEMVIRINDIGNKEYTLRLFGESAGTVPGLLQEGQGVVFSRLKIHAILHQKSFFQMK